MADDNDVDDVRDDIANDLAGDSDQQAVIDQSKLDQDYGTPFSPPSGVQDRIGQTHQSTDTNIDSHEHYDEGIEGAAEVDLPKESAAVDYSSPEDEDQQVA